MTGVGSGGNNTVVIFFSLILKVRKVVEKRISFGSAFHIAVALAKCDLLNDLSFIEIVPW